MPAIFAAGAVISRMAAPAAFPGVFCWASAPSLDRTVPKERNHAILPYLQPPPAASWSVTAALLMVESPVSLDAWWMQT